MMDVLTIFDHLDMSGKQNKLDKSAAGHGTCNSCGREQTLVKQGNRKLCLGCFSFLGACAFKPGAKAAMRFNGAFFADINGAQSWVLDRYLSWEGPDLIVNERDDWFAAAFDFLLNWKGDDPYIFGINTSKSSFGLENLRLNIDHDMILFSGPIDPVTVYRDAQIIRRSAIREAIARGGSRAPDSTPPERYANALTNLGLSGDAYKASKGIKKWTL